VSLLRDPFPKTRTAASYLILNGDGDATRYLKVRSLFGALQTCDRALALGNPSPDDAVAELLAATADLTGRAWLDANTNDPDVLRLVKVLRNGPPEDSPVPHDAAAAAAKTPHLSATAQPEQPLPDIAELDELLSRLLWMRYGPP
jgi:hypothetical protein